MRKHTDCTDGEVRLLLSNETDETIVGLVQYCSSGVWNTVCRSFSNEWGERETRIACTQLGYSHQGTV